jgi:hypothetical protein
VFFPVWVNTYIGVRDTSPLLGRAAASLGARGWRNFAYVVIPSALPSRVCHRRQQACRPDCGGYAVWFRPRVGCGHNNSLWRQTTVVLPSPADVNLFFTVRRSKKFQGQEYKAAELADARFCSSNGAGK